MGTLTKRRAPQAILGFISAHIASDQTFFLVATILTERCSSWNYFRSARVAGKFCGLVQSSWHPLAAVSNQKSRTVSAMAAGGGGCSLSASGALDRSVSALGKGLLLRGCSYVHQSTWRKQRRMSLLVNQKCRCVGLCRKSRL